MFIKRAKSRPSLRARDTDDDAPMSSPLGKTVVTSDAQDVSMSVDDEADTSSGSVMERKKAQKKKQLSKPSRLSFGDQEEGASTPFKPRKSLLSQQVNLHSSSTAPAQATSSPSFGASMYSKEYLSELKASTPSRAPRVDDATPEGQNGQSGEEGGLSAVARDKYASMIVEDSTAGIPDAAAVASAKMKRQAAVESAKRGVDSEDFISFGGGQIAVYDGEKGPHPESRLMREEDEGGEGDEGMCLSLHGGRTDDRLRRLHGGE